MNKGLITREYVNTVIKRRPEHIHKGDLGKVLIVAGSKGMAGAAVLCGKSALRTGSGLVQICVTEEILPIVQCQVTEATCVMRETSQIKLDQYDAIAFGPGLGVDRENKELLTWILENYEKTLVLDADGLNLISHYELQQQVVNRKCQLVITPHIWEACRLCNNDQKPGEDFHKRWALACQLMERYQCLVVLKGHETIVAWDKEMAYINTTGNPGMATAGSGDVLTGIITSLLGQGLSAEDSARAGVFLHGMAGDIGAAEIGQYGLNAGDMTRAVALAIKSIVGD